MVCGLGIIVDLIVDILCFKFSSVAQSFLYLEMLHLFLFTLVPTKYYLDMPTFFQLTFYLYLYLLMYCDSG